MNVTIFPSRAAGEITAPPSKSMAHRLLICAALCRDGVSTVRGIDPSEDVSATLDCLEALGARCRVDGDTVTVQGIDFSGAAESRHLHCRESGSTLRFFIPLSLLDNVKTTFSGSETLLSRPLGVYRDICDERGIFFEQTAKGLTAQGALTSGRFDIPGDISSQFITGLLFALPLLDGDSEIHLIPPVESRSYIELTLAALRQFGVQVSWRDECTLAIPGGQSYTAADISVEGDYSNAAFLHALNEVGSAVEVEGLRADSLQGDRVYLEHFESLREGTPTISLADCPDLGPILFAIAAAGKGAHFTDTRRLRIKESDRAEVMAQELRKFGAQVIVNEDDVTVAAEDFHAPTVHLDGHNDHRIVMSLAVLLTRVGGTIEGAEAVRKSYPGFFDALQRLGVEMTIDYV
ncbi:MAG: 3-phosphoshikimate 1-carboxyvinyltransferase [Clostridia bacterium]|nr:3-phosphoshikimate 1-carboxyvinyltransferase [Clostridia bacterium]